jgi:hypothetical protein
MASHASATLDAAFLNLLRCIEDEIRPLDKAVRCVIEACEKAVLLRGARRSRMRWARGQCVTALAEPPLPPTIGAQHPR